MKKFKRIVSTALTAVMLATAVSLPSTADAKKSMPFKDLTKNWYREAIQYVYDNNLMNGTSSTEFEPTGNMTRGMFVTVLGRLCGAKEVETNKFSDVKSGQWYSGYVGWAVNAGVTNGFEDGTFMPDENISRQDAATMLARYLDGDGVLLDFVDELPDDYEDGDTIGKWAKDGVEKLSFYGIFKGDDYGCFNPKNNLNRAEGATMFMRLHQSLLEAKSATATVSAYDIMNSPESFYSNFDSKLSTDTSLPTLSLTPHEYYNAPWYVGMNLLQSDITFGALEYVKLCYKADKTSNAYMTVETPVYENEHIDPIYEGTEGEYKTVIFALGDHIRAHRSAYFSAEQPFSSGTYALRNLNLRSLYNTHINVSICAFGDDVSEAEMLYMAYFSTEEAAKSYTASSDSGYFKNGKLENEAEIKSADTEVIDEYKNAMYARIDEIKATASEVTPDDIKGKVYYVSSINGDDSNDGLSPETAFKTTGALYKNIGNITVLPKFKEGDGIFFERGGAYYSTKMLSTNYSGDSVLEIEVSDVTIGAYGTGAKPILTNSLDVNGSKNWESVDGYPNLWKLTEKLEGKGESKAYNDVGSIAVYTKDGKTGFGVKLNPSIPADPFGDETVFIGGRMSNGLGESFDIAEGHYSDLSVLQHNLEYFHDLRDGTLYMYCDAGNPGEVYERVVVSKKGGILMISANAANVTVDNITVAYGGSHGFDVSGVKNLVVKNCTVEWIGGSYQGGEGNDNTRFGNGFQNWGSCDGIFIDNCYFDQMFDSGPGTQSNWGSDPGSSISYVNDFHIDNCVLTNSNSPVEIWNLASDNISANISVSGNYLYNDAPENRFGAQRLSGDGLPVTGGSMFYFSPLDPMNYQNCVIEDNVIFMDYSTIYLGRQFLGRGDQNGIFTRNNIFIGGVEGVSDTFGSLPDVDIRNGNTPPNVYDIRKLTTYYTEDYIKMWTGLGLDHGSTFYFIK